MEVRIQFSDRGYFTKSSSSIGIQVGGVGSSYGVLGSWTTVMHDEEDPVGKS